MDTQVEDKQPGDVNRSKPTGGRTNNHFVVAGPTVRVADLSTALT